MPDFDGAQRGEGNKLDSQPRRAPSRRSALLLLASTAVFGGPTLAQAPAVEKTAAARGEGTFDHQVVIRLARILGERPFEPRTADIPAELKALTYDSYREIQFRRDKALWQDSGSDFRLHLFHLGFLHDKPVQIDVVANGHPAPIPYSSSLFEFGKASLPPRLPISLGFAGFAVSTTLNSLKVQDELISFLGASYFRFLGRGHRYGLSVRALALDVGGAEPEEFPFFRSLWLEEPARNSVDLVVHALLDSPSVSGAFRFVVTPGPETTVSVTATLFPRREIARIGIAPLTSMYFTGEADREQRPDFRHEIHDSDGLQLNTGAGEWLWRPIRNPRHLTISSFSDANPRGFGLMQRDREFGHYQDLEAQYHARPGYWVEPVGEWGEGRVELIEIPTQGEAFDNIVCCWTPNKPLPVGQATELSYRITALSGTGGLNGLGQVHNSFGAADMAGAAAGTSGSARNRFIVDFSGGDLEHYLSDPKRVDIVASTSVGAIAGTIIDANPTVKGFRAMVDATLAPGETAALRIFLRSGGRTLTETWTSTWSAPEAAAGVAGPGKTSGG